MTDRIESMQIDVDEIRRNRAAIAELVMALRDAKDSLWNYGCTRAAEKAERELTKYDHIVDANKMVPPALYLCTKCGGANYGCGCDSFKHCTVPLYTNQSEKE